MKSHKTKILCDVTYTFEKADKSSTMPYDFFQIDSFLIGNTDLVSVLPEDYLENLDAALYEALKGSDND